MALSTGNAPLWSDITAIYDSLRTVQQQHSLTQTAIPAYQDTTMLQQTIVDLNDAINNLRTERHLSSTAATGITVPPVGALISPTIFTTMLNNVNAKKGICHFDFSDCSFTFSFNSCPSFNSCSSFNTCTYHYACPSFTCFTEFNFSCDGCPMFWTFSFSGG